MNTETQCCEKCKQYNPETQDLYCLYDKTDECECHTEMCEHLENCLPEASALPRSVKIGDDPLQYAGGNGKTTTEGTVPPQPTLRDYSGDCPCHSPQPQQEGWEKVRELVYNDHIAGGTDEKTARLVADTFVESLLTSARREGYLAGVEASEKAMRKIRTAPMNGDYNHEWIDTCDVWKALSHLKNPVPTQIER